MSKFGYIENMFLLCGGYIKERFINILAHPSFMKAILYSGTSGGKHDLYIMRGLPGSGKSTCAREIGGEIFSTDDFFIRDGVYEFDPSKIGEAHEWNQRRTEKALREGMPSVVVDNTNTMAWEIRPYVELGMKEAYSIILAEPDTLYKWDVNVLAEKNGHGVPEEVIKKMMDRYEHDLTLDQILQAESPFAQKI